MSFGRYGEWYYSDEFDTEFQLDAKKGYAEKFCTASVAGEIFVHSDRLFSAVYSMTTTCLFILQCFEWISMIYVI